MDVKKAIAYVQAQGNAIEQARLAATLWDEPPPQTALRELAALQKADGGFAYWVPEVSNVCDTAYGRWPGSRWRLSGKQAENAPTWKTSCTHFSWQWTIPKPTGRSSTWRACTPTVTPTWLAPSSKQQGRRARSNWSRTRRRG